MIFHIITESSPKQNITKTSLHITSNFQKVLTPRRDFAMKRRVNTLASSTAKKSRHWREEEEEDVPWRSAKLLFFWRRMGVFSCSQIGGLNYVDVY
jgi:hypothetical protein